MNQLLTNLCLVTVVWCFAVGGVVHADDSTPLEAELEELTRAVTRLVEAVEAQAKARDGSQDMSKLRVAVSVLGIRARRYEALQTELSNLEDREALAARYIETTESKIRNVRDRLTSATDDVKREELKEKLANLEINLKANESRLEYARRRQLDVQSQLIEQEGLVRDLEEVVEGWLSGLKIGGSPSN